MKHFYPKLLLALWEPPTDKLKYSLPILGAVTFESLAHWLNH